MKTLTEVLEKKMNGLYYGNRVLLPFAADILKMVIKDDIITDFSSKDSGAKYSIRDNFTEIYFCDYPELNREIRDYDVIKLVLVEKGEDVFDFKQHQIISIKPLEKHFLSIEKIDDEILFFE